MTSLSEPNLSKALHDLVDVPDPANLADQALLGARRVRTRRMALSGTAALAAVSLVAAPFLTRLGSDPSPSQAIATPSTAPDFIPVNFASWLGPAPQPCVEASPPIPRPTSPGPPPDGRQTNTTGVKSVAEADWPEFVRIAVNKLPPRTDYELQSSYGVCTPNGSKAPNAYAVINIGGPMRKHGHLTLNLMADVDSAPVTCAALRKYVEDETRTPKGAEVLFCDEATASTPFVYGIRWQNTLTVGAKYGDRLVRMESISASDKSPEIGAEALRPVVTDRALADLLPVA